VEGDDSDDLLIVVPQSFRHSRGDEGAGPPQSSTTTGGQDGTYVPAVPATSTGAGVKPTRRPLQIHPPPIMPAPAISKGGGVQPTRHPHSSSFTPHWGILFFCSGSLTGGSVNPKRRPLLLRLSPLIGGNIYFNECM